MRIDRYWMNASSKFSTTLSRMMGFEKDFPFCSNPDCVLYVRVGDPGVIGNGNWAQLPGGRIVGRSLYNGVYLCDSCGPEWYPVKAVAI